VIAAVLTAASTAAGAPPVAPSIVTVPTANPGRVTAALTACHVAGDLLDRYATFSAQMVAVPQTQGMSLRLQLYEHTPGTSGYHLVNGVPGFGVWENSAPGIGVFAYSQEVTSLTAPASFRVQVGYRWYDAEHEILKRASRSTVSCTEPAQLANLVAGALSITPDASPATATYGVTVRNEGAVAAGPFDVGLSVDGVPLADQTINDLQPGTRTVVEFDGPACTSGGTLGVVVDPAGAIAETTKVDNTRTVTCR
jgi:hypothetical protein